MLYNFLKKHKKFLLPWYDKAQIASVKAAAVEQKLTETYQQLGKIVPDLTEQYTTFKIDSKVLETRTRTPHSFQIKLAMKAIDIVLADKVKHNSTHQFTLYYCGYWVFIGNTSPLSKCDS
jgi:hypothetical protein